MQFNKFSNRDNILSSLSNIGKNQHVKLPFDRYENKSSKINLYILSILLIILLGSMILMYNKYSPYFNMILSDQNLLDDLPTFSEEDQKFLTEQILPNSFMGVIFHIVSHDYYRKLENRRSQILMDEISYFFMNNHGIFNRALMNLISSSPEVLKDDDNFYILSKFIRDANQMIFDFNHKVLKNLDLLLKDSCIDLINNFWYEISDKYFAGNIIETYLEDVYINTDNHNSNTLEALNLFDDLFGITDGPVKSIRAGTKDFIIYYDDVKNNFPKVELMSKSLCFPENILPCYLLFNLSKTLKVLKTVFLRDKQFNDMLLSNLQIEYIDMILPSMDVMHSIFSFAKFYDNNKIIKRIYGTDDQDLIKLATDNPDRFYVCPETSANALKKHKKVIEKLISSDHKTVMQKAYYDTHVNVNPNYFLNDLSLFFKLGLKDRSLTTKQWNIAVLLDYDFSGIPNEFNLASYMDSPTTLNPFLKKVGHGLQNYSNADFMNFVKNV